LRRWVVEGREVVRELSMEKKTKRRVVEEAVVDLGGTPYLIWTD
jgi:hypothetical protein